MDRCRVDTDEERYPMAMTFMVLTVVIALIAICFQPRQREVAALPVPSRDVKELIRAGRRIAAIRSYRRRTGVTLDEASRVIGHHAA